MIDKSKYKLAQDADDHFLVEHPDGSKFKVAKKALSKEVHESIKKFFGGGMVQAQAFPNGGVVQPEASEVEEEEEAPEETEESDEQPHATAENPNIGVEVAPVTPGATAPQQAPIMQDVIPEYNKAFGKLTQGAEEQAVAESQVGKELAPELKLAANSIQDLQKGAQEDLLDRQNDSEEFKNALRNNKIDPNGLYQDKSTLGSIKTGLALVLGGIGAGGTNGQNLVADMLDKRIQRDIDAQKANQANTQSLYKLNLEQEGSDQAATLTSHKQLLDHIQVEAEKAAANAADPQAAARLHEFAGNIGLKQSAIDNQLSYLGLQRRLAGAPFQKEAASILPDAQKKLVINLPDGKTSVLANSEKQAQDANKAVSTYGPMLSNMQRIEELGHRVINTGSPEAEEVRSRIPTLLLQMKQAQGQGVRINPETIDLLQSQVGNPTKAVDLLRGDTRLKTFRANLKNQLDATLGSASSAYQPASAVKTYPRVK